VSLNPPIRLSWVRPDVVRRHARRFENKIGVLLSPILISGLLGASLSVPRIARANSGHIFLETIGISIAVGTVLGASTLPFYDQPGKHLMNLAYGASAGAVTGIGILVYGWIAGSAPDEYGEAGSNPARSPHNLNFVDGRASRFSDGTGPAIARNDFNSPRAGSVYPAQFWTPLVSLNW
jgi:hypothetical protein